MDLEDVIKRCKLGEKEAFQELLKTVEKNALATAFLLSGNRGIAEDILQETYIKIFKQIKTLKDYRSFKVWFHRILIRTGWNITKKYSKLIPVDISADDNGLFYKITAMSKFNVDDATKLAEDYMKDLKKIRN